MATDPSDPSSRPKNDDVSMCFRCGSLAIFDNTVPDKVRKPTPRERDELMAIPKVQQMLMVWRAATQAADDYEDWRSGEEGRG